MIEKVNIEQFLALIPQSVLLDVRSPGEYEHAHIPTAVSMPLFDNEERKVVGTAYKQESREQAIKIGLDYYGPKMRAIVEQVEGMTTNGEKPVLVHCWRGGMRSGAIAWLLDLYGFKVLLLEGGYKAFRNWVLERFEQPYSLKIVGGYTGSAKTPLLQKMAQNGHYFIDLEGLANHKGSALGGIGMGEQPKQEMFENLLAMELYKNRNETDILLEDESQRIGSLQVPNALYKQMKASTVFFLDIPFEARLAYLTEEYGVLDREEIKAAVQRISKRLGGLETKNALVLLEEGELMGAFEILLKYYDKWYLKGLLAKENYIPIASETVDVATNELKLTACLQKK